MNGESMACFSANELLETLVLFLSSHLFRLLAVDGRVRAFAIQARIGIYLNLAPTCPSSSGNLFFVNHIFPQ